MGNIIYEGQELLPITSDVVFKAIFGSEENKDLLASLLNSFVDVNIANPELIELVGTEVIKHYEDDKLCRLDIRVKTEDNEHIDIEIQVADKKDMVNRSLFYLSKLYTEQMKEGMKYKELGKTIALNFLCFNLFEDEERYIRSFRYHDTVTKEELTDIMELNFVELTKVKKLKENNQTESLQDLWSKFLVAESEEELRMLSNQSDVIQKAVKKLKYVSADDIVRFEYDQRMKARLDYASDMANSRDEGMQEGLQKGIQKGMQEGLQKGMQEGIQKGMHEGKREEKMKLAKNLLDVLDIATIANKTGLTAEEIEQLKN